MKVDSPSGGIDCRSGGLNIQVEGNERAEWTRHYTVVHYEGKRSRTTRH